MVKYDVTFHCGHTCTVLAKTVNNATKIRVLEE